MKHLYFFEKFGINKNLEEQCKLYFDEINNSSDKVFKFKYTNETGSYDFKINIGISSNLGEFKFTPKSDKITNLTIGLKNRNDYPTLLHELKHLDFTTRNLNHHNKDLFSLSSRKLSKIKAGDKLKFMQETFYLLDKNEFESRYHGYYAEFDKFISENISNNPTSSEIYKLFEMFLIGYRDRSWTWYVSDEIKLEDYLKEDEINRLFHQFIYTKNFYQDEYDSVFKYLRSIIKRKIRNNFHNYTKEEIYEINRMKVKVERMINKRLLIYKKKFLRLVTIMVDKWCR